MKNVNGDRNLNLRLDVANIVLQLFPFNFSL